MATADSLDHVGFVNPTTLHAIKMKAEWFHDDETCELPEVRGRVPSRFKSMDRQSGKRVYHVRKGDEGLLFRKSPRGGEWSWVIFVREGESIHGKSIVIMMGVMTHNTPWCC